ncbi:MAG: bifunctional folylpolyglutamate synthase/dihydrofolate synthase, partial [Candidatus Saccharimonadales bacterium]
GLTVSPHVDGVNERVQVDGSPLPAAGFGQELAGFLKVIEDTGLRPSYFVLLYALAMWVFAKRGVDYAVVETGMGGLHDATNVSGRPDKVCIITDIGFDHEEVLGRTLAAIAAQKIGIVHRHNHVFMYGQAPEVMRVVRRYVAGQDAELHQPDETSERQAVPDLMTDGMAAYQRRNWLLARAVYRYLQERDGLKDLDGHTLAKTRAVTVPARMEVRRIGGKTVVMDGAHNSQKLASCIDSFKRLYPGVRPDILLSIKDHKNYEDLAALLKPFAARVIITTFDTAQDSQAISMDPAKLAAALRDAGVKDVTLEPDQHQAYERLLGSPGKVCLITGSFYLLSQLRGREDLS